MTNPLDLDHEADTEQYDEIPWSHLVEDLGRSGPSIALVAAVVLVVGGVLGFVAALLLGGDGDAATAAPMVATIAPEPSTTVLAVESSTVTTPAPPETAAPAPDVVFSEADLMAVATDHEVRTAAARAEWFVRDYFTADESGEAGAGGAELIETFGVGVQPGATTYVEWAKAVVVNPVGPGAFEVTVAFGTLAADGEIFVRHPVRGVVVPVAIGVDLSSAVTGLPRPVELATLAVTPPTIVDQDPPQAVVDDATAEALRFGTDPAMVRSWLDRDAWHIVMHVQFAGGAWPLQIDIPQPGNAP